METNVCNLISNLVEYAVRRELIGEEDRVFYCNRLAEELKVSAFEPSEAPDASLPLEEILGAICDYAIENKIIPDRGVTGRDLFDTKLMGILTPRPSEVIRKFNQLYAESPQKATDYYYRLACDSDYIRTYRIKKDMKWVYEGKYGKLDITINLSKPEKDPKAIAAAKRQKQTGYPKCALCRENEGFAGSMSQAARQSHRLIPMSIAGQNWFLQYSPYVYYNEHCIVLSAEHTPMKIDRSTFVKQMDFVTLFPHYMLGSNADLPIVGGSILTHDHMQGGHYTFAMERAGIERELHFDGFDQVQAGIVHWPMSVIRLRSADREALIELSDRILQVWRTYTDASATVFAETDGEPHNTVTPIARRRGEDYEIDLVLRNNLTSDEHPLGVFHPHADKHNIKKENIGLIEVMGLAVLPARLKEEMALLAEYLVEGKEIASCESIAKHAVWVKAFADCYHFTAENVQEILQHEIGKTFEGVLEDAGIYSCTPDGREAFLRFVAAVNRS
ncbi:MAG: UDP-glucose--hexose-1-phosphate uridylyltransferase [Clostridia bacterium]|nr:UDP-glucose--hexose-1-phosphate uridylyltransferase [Clostridia bacterium]